MNETCTCCGEVIPDDRFATDERNEPYNYDHLPNPDA